MGSSRREGWLEFSRFQRASRYLGDKPCPAAMEEIDVRIWVRPSPSPALRAPSPPLGEREEVRGLRPPSPPVGERGGVRGSPRNPNVASRYFSTGNTPPSLVSNL